MPHEITLAHQDDAVPSLALSTPGLPEELVQLIEAMLAKAPDDRPTLNAVRAVLKRLNGTKIPTMTAAGISMSTPPTTDKRASSDMDGMNTVEHVTSPEKPRARAAGDRTAHDHRHASAGSERLGGRGHNSGVPLPPPPSAPPQRPSQPSSNFSQSAMPAFESMPAISIDYCTRRCRAYKRRCRYRSSAARS